MDELDNQEMGNEDESVGSGQDDQEGSAQGTEAAAPEPGAEPTTEAFAALLAGVPHDSGRRLQKGEKLRARVVRVSGEWIFVGLGGKQEGAIRRDEFTAAEEETPVPAEGDELEAYVLSTQGGEVVLTMKVGSRGASLEGIEDAWKSDIPVEGRVAQVVKGGYEVRISGTRAFCPLSQIDVRWAKNPDEHVGQTYSFRILEFKERGRNIVVSRRALLEEERAKQLERLREVVVPGAEVAGTVRSIQDFGAFVDIGGVDALIPISEVSWARVESAGDVLSEGEQVTAKVLNVDWDRDRVSLSLKALQGDPWTRVGDTYRAGERIRGTVARLAPFGAFVTLEPGVDGLVHISAIGAGRRIKHPKEVLSPGEQVEVEILAVDPEKRRISLSLEHRWVESLGEPPRPGTVVAGTVESIANFGVFVRVPSGHTGLVPNAEMGTQKGTDHSKMFRPGDPMEVAVLDVEDGGKRIRLSRKQLQKDKEAEVAREYHVSQSQEPESLGTLGDLFGARLKNKR